MTGLFVPILLAIVAVVLAGLSYRGIRRGGARYYTLEREAILRRASLTLFFSVLLFLGAIGLLAYQQQQLTAVDEPAVVEGEGDGGDTAVPDSAEPTATFEVEQFPPTETPTPVSNEPTATPTPLVCRAIVEGTSGNGLTLRTVPGGDEISVLPDGSVLTVLNDAPQEANGFTWRKVRVVGGDEGWVAEDFLTIRAPCSLE